MCVTGDPEGGGEENREEIIFKEIIAKDFPKHLQNQHAK